MKLAIDGIKITASGLGDRLKDYQAKDTIQVTLFHQDVLRILPVTLENPRPTRYQVIPIQNAQAAQQQKLAGWLGISANSLF